MVYRLLTELVALRLFAYSLAAMQALVSVKSNKIKIMQRHSHLLRRCAVQRPERSLGKETYITWKTWVIMPASSNPLTGHPARHPESRSRFRGAQKRTTSHFRPTQGVDDTIISATNPWVDHDFSLRGIHPETTGAMYMGPYLPN